MATQSFTDFEIFRDGVTEPLTVFVKDPISGQLVDVAATSTFNLIDLTDDSVEISQSFDADGAGVVRHKGTGIYQFNFDSSTYENEYLAAFRCTLAGNVSNLNFYVKAVPNKYFKYAAVLRSQVDKARKSIKDYIANIDRPNEPFIELFYGFDDD